LKLDSRTVARLPQPVDQRRDVIYFDEALRGFGLRVRAGSRGPLRSWVVQYRSKNRTRRILIGPAEVIGAAQARQAAERILAAVKLGGDPQGDKVADRLRNARSLASVAQDFLDAKQPELRHNSFRGLALYLTGPAYFGPLHPVGVNEITRADVATRVNAIARNSGTVTAARARSALSSLYAWAMGEGIAEANPVAGSNRPANSMPRDRVLSDDEIKAIWIASGDGDFGRIVKLLLVTAQRRVEVGGMRCSELDLEARAWTLPKERTKNGRAHVLPLSPLAMSSIESVPRREGRDCLFGDRADGGFTAWSKAKRLLDERSGVKDWGLHDLRRTASTGMANLGVQPHVIECVLNHQSGFRAGVSSVYNKSPYMNEMRQALLLWADHIEALIIGGERRVVPFPVNSAAMS
jgi:integrase